MYTATIDRALTLFSRAILVHYAGGEQNVCGSDINVLYKYENDRTRARRPSNECSRETFS